MSEPRTALVMLGPGASTLRRSIGPSAWAVLEAALTEAHPTADGLVADVSVRQLASTLGLARDTVARALLVLRRAAIVVPEQTRTGGGAFAAGRYAIHVAADVLALAAEPLPARSPARSRPERVLPVEQLTMLSV